MAGPTICIAANFTIEPIRDVLAYWLEKLGLAAEIRFAPYNQIFQQLLEGGMLRANRGGINLVGLDLEEWLQDGPDARAQLEQVIGDLLGALHAAGAQGAGGAVLLFPASPWQGGIAPPAQGPASGNRQHGQIVLPESPWQGGMAPPAQGPGGERVAALAAGKARIVSECASLAGWSVVDLETAARAYAVAETRDAFADELGHIPFTEEMYAAAATAAARWVRASCTKSKKVVVLDCDNTLWQGICGEGAVQVTEPYRKLQEFMLRQQDQGMLIALASKNNESDVMAVLDSGSCVLRSEHLTAWRINWQPKSENLRELSEELGLALNSFVFLDDSSYECLEVRNQCPDVTAIALPADAEAIPEFLEHLWVFDRAAATEEDRNRARMYQAERQRAELSRALTPEEFLASLKLEIEIAPAQSTELARVAQLTQRTTQFNMTGVTHNEQSLAALLAQGSRECRTVRVRDTFGDYGLVGVLLFAVEGASLRVENFLLSCRALGRRVEDRMVEELRRRAVEAGAERLCIPVVPTARNRPALEFLHRLCGVPVDAAEPFECVLSASGQESEWRPAAAAPVEAAAAPARHAAASAGEDIATLAGQLRTASAQMQAARASRRQRAGAASTAPRDEAERALAEIWSEYLGVAPVGIDDAFADLGGDSLTAARILARVHRQFGVGLTLAQFFAAPTVGGMAGALAQHA